MEKIFIILRENEKDYNIAEATSISEERIYIWQEFFQDNFVAGDLVCMGFDQWDNLNRYYAKDAGKTFKYGTNESLKTVLATYKDIFLFPSLNECDVCKENPRLGKIGHYDVVCEKHFKNYHKMFLL